LLDKDEQHLAFITYRYQHEFQHLSASGERENVLLNQELSDVENEMLDECFEFDKDLEKRFGGATGGLIITDENSKIVLHERPPPLDNLAFNQLPNLT
jgi:hypothetical protein